MKRPNFTLNFFLNHVSEFLSTNTRAFSIILTITLIHTFTNLNAQVIDCNVILACNDGVQISLDEDCDVTIEPDMILESPAYGDAAYDVTAKLPNGTALPTFTDGTDSQGRPIIRTRVNRAHVNLNLEVKVTLRGCGNSCWGSAKIEDKLAPIITECPCEERITSISGTLLPTSSTYNRPNATAGCPGTSVNGVNFVIRNFAVDANGFVDISLPQTNLRMSLYQGSFVSSSPCTNLLETNVNAISRSLTSGINYVLVISTASNTGVPAGGFLYDAFIDSREGNVKSSVPATVCVRACDTEATLLAQTVSNASTPPRFTDACGGTLTFTKRDEVIDLTCSNRYSRMIKRTWTAADASGNVSGEKSQFFYFERLSLDDVRCPDDWIRDCGTTFATLPNGAPTPAVSGMPMPTGCHNIQVFYDDIVFEQCGAGIKVFRQWTILDWCSGEDKICAQTIKVEDNQRPVITCPADITSQPGVPVPNPAAVVAVTPGTCMATWQVIPPIAVSDCSGVTWEVFFKKADSNGNPPPNTPFVKVDGPTSVTGTRPAMAATISQTARPYTINGLPLGRTWLKYVVTDECGNSTECFTEVDVVDLTPPTAICEDQTVVSIDDLGWGELYAETLDNHSNDNCGPVTRFEVKRKTTHCAGFASDLNFGPKVRFCCADITAPISYVTVVLRVYDAAGNFNECETQVRVQNQRPATIICPSNKTLVCGDSRIDAWVSGTARFDTTFFGRPTTGGVCSNLQFNSRIISNTIDAKCKVGVVTREWFLVSNPAQRCTQTLTVTSPTFSSANVTFPADVTLPGCNIALATPDALNSRPSVSNITCRDIGISFTDQEFYTVTDACIKILRTWRVIDWCSFQGNQVVAEKIQTIKLMGTGGPVFSGCANQTHDTDPGACDKALTVSTNATDECTAPEEITYTWSVDLGKNNSVDMSGTGKTFSRTFPIGLHRVTFTATNRCGTPKTCSFDIRINGKKKPTPVCIREVVWVMGSNGSTEVWASDFNLKSENNCGLESALRYSFNEAGNQPARTFTCADIPNGQVARIPLRMYVFDENGNFDFCEVTLILQDSPLTNACRDVTSLLPTVSGRIATENNEGVNNSEVALTNMNTAKENMFMTKDDGQYTFTGLDVFDTKSIGVYNNSDPLNGVSTLDLVLIQRHILGIQKIESPYKLIAADVNNSKNITASDLVSLRKLILGITNEIDNNTSWKFIPADHTFADPTNPYNYAEKVNIDSIYEDKNNVNFTAIKVGDINGSAKANANGSALENRSSNALFTIDDKKFEAGKLLKMDIKAGDIMEIMGAQFALNFDADVLEFSTLRSGKADVKSYHANLSELQNGKIKMSIDIPAGVQLQTNDVIFTIEFRTKSTGSTDAIKLSDDLSAEIYDMDASVRKLDIQLRNSGIKGHQNFLYQNQPNPFKDFTTISFELAQAGKATLKVMDVTGKMVFNTENQFNKGYNTVTIEHGQLNGSGVYYYQIEAENFSATKKMILIE